MVSAENLRQILQHRITEAGGAAIWARNAKISHSMVSLTLTGERECGDKMAAALGYKRKVVFEALQVVESD